MKIQIKIRNPYLPNPTTIETFYLKAAELTLFVTSSLSTKYNNLNE